MLKERLQKKILNTIDEMALIQAYVYRETNLDRIDAARDDYFDQLNILRILLSIQIPDRKERNAVVDYIREGIFDREWRKYVTEVETGDQLPCLGKDGNLPTDEISQLRKRGNLL